MASSSVSSDTPGSSASGSSFSAPSFSGTPVITTEKLTGPNYASWVVAVRVWFRGQGFEDFLTDPPPTDLSLSELKRWRQVDAQLLTLLWQSMEPTIQQFFRVCESCHQVWSLAQEMYTTDVTRIYDIIGDLSRLQLSDSGIPGLFGHARVLMADYNQVFPLSTDLKVQSTQREHMVLIHALRALPPAYEPIRAQILGGTTLPSLSEAFSRVMRATPQTPTLASVPAMASALVTQSPSFGDSVGRASRGRGRGGGRGNGGRGRPRCSYCNKLGHTRDTCYALHGRPSPLAHAAQSVHSPSLLGPFSQQSLGVYPPSTVTISEEDYSRFLQLQAAQQVSQPVSPLPPPSSQASSSTALFSHSVPLSSSNPWIIDSGATDHMSGNSSSFSALRHSDSLPNVTLADGSSIAARGIGSASLLPSLPLSSVLYLPSFPCNLLSVSKLTKMLNCSVHFDPTSVTIQDLRTRAVIGTGRESHGLYYFSPPSPSACGVAATPLQIHCRLGHPSSSSLKHMIPSHPSVSDFLCESCQLGKHSRVHFSRHLNNRATAPFDLVHSDVWGPSRIVSKSGFRYFVTFIDDYSRVTWVFLMRDRSELFSIFTTFCVEIRTQFGVPIRILRSDNAREYFSSQFNSFMASVGMIHQSSCPHTPQQNGVAERKHRHLLDTARTLMLHMHVPMAFWADAILTSCYLINRMPSSVLTFKIPYSLLYPRAPLYSVSPRIFGCVCFVHNLSPGVDKFAARSHKCIFLGYGRHQKGYVCYSPALRRYFVSADVTFFESVPFYPPPPVSSPPGDSISSDAVLPAVPLSHTIPIFPLPSTSLLSRRLLSCRLP